MQITTTSIGKQEAQQLLCNVIYLLLYSKIRFFRKGYFKSKRGTRRNHSLQPKFALQIIIVLVTFSKSSQPSGRQVNAIFCHQIRSSSQKSVDQSIEYVRDPQFPSQFNES